ncbi:hypothetical protein BC936DRAFT_140826 [Jimgerdemannia flammicorona]|uniref:Uncharacterized protein n=1 Tax=Jimgerdemannia flammicorona TaxID=994334 RepID=A0A433A3D0_9FUNG|nr:hypothetical protein BC936DRAFT_140826 [Jimgerdemannia flammicorona]
MTSDYNLSRTGVKFSKDYRSRRQVNQSRVGVEIIDPLHDFSNSTYRYTCPIRCLNPPCTTAQSNQYVEYTKLNRLLLTFPSSQSIIPPNLLESNPPSPDSRFLQPELGSHYKVRTFTLPADMLS